MKKRFLISLAIIGIMSFSMLGCDSAELKEFTNSLDELGDALDEFSNTMEQIEENITLENVCWKSIEDNTNYEFKNGTLTITNNDTSTTHTYTFTETIITIDGESQEYSLENGCLTLNGKKFIAILNENTIDAIKDNQNNETKTTQ